MACSLSGSAGLVGRSGQQGRSEPGGPVVQYDEAGEQAEREARDFLVSYTQADRAWAEWLAWELEAAGYRTHEFGDSVLIERRARGVACAPVWRHRATA